MFFDDMDGSFYALNAATGQWLWGQKIGGLIGGGVITYTANGAQNVAVAVGFTSIVGFVALVEIGRKKLRCRPADQTARLWNCCAADMAVPSGDVTNSPGNDQAKL